MNKVNVINRAGEKFEIEARNKLTFMDVLRDAGFDELEAMCGGSCSCATCHIFVDPAYIEKIPPMTEDEHELLDGTEHRISNSRLACQIRMEENLDGITIEIAPEG